MLYNILHSPLTADKNQTANKNKNVAFGGNFAVETLTHTNIGSCLNGYIGKIKVRNANNEEKFLNVFKSHLGNCIENYSIKNDYGDLIGEANVTIKKFEPGTYDVLTYPTDPSHVFVDNLRNYSNPKTPFYKKGLEYMKDIGVRLLQIAQRRSDEARCNGEIKLIAMGEAKDWYKNVIGMKEEFDVNKIDKKIKFCPFNPNSMILPAEKKEPLSRLQGGL